MTQFRELTRWQRSEITAIFKKSRKCLCTPEMDISYAPATLSYGRILIVIPRKVGTAPTRNLIRRRIKSFFYEQKLFEKGLDWIVFVKPATAARTYQEFLAVLSDGFTKGLSKYLSSLSSPSVPS